VTETTRLQDLTERLTRICAEIECLRQDGAESEAEFWRREKKAVSEKIIACTGGICPYCAGKDGHADDCPIL
jgi:hypothetical protein